MQATVTPHLAPERGHQMWLAMQARIVAAGLDQPDNSRTWRRMGLLVPLLGLALGWTWQQSSIAATGLGSAALALLLAQFAFLGHDAGHRSAHSRAPINQWLGQLCMTVVTGLAFGEWWRRHQAHHRHCQQEHLDPDLVVGVVASLTLESARAKRGLGRWMTRQQGWHCGLLSLLFAHSQRHLAQWGALREPRRFGLDVLMLAVHFALWWGLPLLLGVSLLQVAVVYTLPLFILGPYLALLFWLNHIGMPLVADARQLSFVEHQTATSRTLLTPRGWDWFFGGLNLQIEHHLFPRVSAQRLRAVQAVVRPELSAGGLRYHGVSLGLGLREVAAHFRRVARSV